MLVHGVSTVFASRGEPLKVYTFPSSRFWMSEPTGAVDAQVEDDGDVEDDDDMEV
jgi:hypothetical protein